MLLLHGLAQKHFFRRPAEGMETQQEFHEKHEAWRARAKRRVLSNDSSAECVLRDLQSATDAGAQGADDFASTQCMKNARRDLMRKMLKGSVWPEFYYADVPVKNLKNSSQAKTTRLPFLLPHELVPMYMRREGTWTDVQETDAWLKERKAVVAAQLRVPPERLLALGLHGDGVPIGGNMNEDSLDVFNINLCSSKANSALRVPFTCIQLRHLAGDDTFREIVRVLCWSLRCLASGVRPSARHDGTAWGPEDRTRQAQPAGSTPARGARPAEGDSSLGVQAFLAEIRGDWAWLQKLLKFPAWNKSEGFCWLCRVLLPHLRLADTAAAPWRWQRYQGDDFLQELRSQGREVSELFTLPGVTPSVILPDWMHASDMGVAQDVSAHVLVEALEKMEGGSKEKRLQVLWGLLQSFYKVHGEAERLTSLELKHFIATGDKANKLKCKAAQARHLVPFLPWVASRFLDPQDPREGAVISVAENLAACYRLMDTPGDALATACRRLCNAYAALEAHETQRNPDSAHWRIKPKLHLFQELCEYGDRAPRLFWCYKDETFGNECAALARRRGGPNNAGTNTKRVLEGWCASTPFPRP